MYNIDINKKISQIQGGRSSFQKTSNVLFKKMYRISFKKSIREALSFYFGQFILQRTQELMYQ